MHHTLYVMLPLLPTKTLRKMFSQLIITLRFKTFSNIFDLHHDERNIHAHFLTHRIDELVHISPKACEHVCVVYPPLLTLGYFLGEKAAHKTDELDTFFCGHIRSLHILPVDPGLLSVGKSLAEVNKLDLDLAVVLFFFFLRLGDGLTSTYVILCATSSTSVF